MNEDLKKMKKDELIEIIQKLKNEQKKVYEMYGVTNENDYILVNLDLVSSMKTVKSLIEENDKLKKEVEEKEKLNKEIQKLKNEQKKLIQEYKENNGVQKIKNERNAGRKSKFTDKQIEKILKDRENGASIRNIAKFNNCSVGLVHKIINEHKEE